MKTGALLMALAALAVASASANASSLGKSLPDGDSVTLANVLVKAVFPLLDRVYVQDANRACGIRVQSPVVFTEGAAVSLSGAIKTDPARHFASSDTSPSSPPMGMRVRLKAGFNVSGFSPNVQVILKALKEYGMMLADNGSNWYISGAPDARWNDDELTTLRNVKGSDFEVVKMGAIVTQ